MRSAAGQPPRGSHSTFCRHRDRKSIYSRHFQATSATRPKELVYCFFQRNCPRRNLSLKCGACGLFSPPLIALSALLTTRLGWRCLFSWARLRLFHAACVVAFLPSYRSKRCVANTPGHHSPRPVVSLLSRDSYCQPFLFTLAGSYLHAFTALHTWPTSPLFIPFPPLLASLSRNRI